nr:MAG TPA: hypothetical protein [Caudoviricetes sp.]
MLCPFFIQNTECIKNSRYYQRGRPHAGRKTARSVSLKNQKEILHFVTNLVEGLIYE